MMVALLAGTAACQKNDRVQRELSGATMGTRYAVTVVSTKEPPAATLAEDIRQRLHTLNAEMSTYDADSELSRFNRFASTDWFNVSGALCSAIENALAIGQQTDGAFDITLGGVVNLWGFGPGAPISEAPARTAIDAALETTGYRKLHADCSRSRLRKDDPMLYVDLSGYAKGLAADRIGDLLHENGIADHLVEIGGEIRASGFNVQGEKWRIAVEQPGTGGRTTPVVLRLSDVAVATSGDYRNYVDIDGVRYSHTIDGKTGAPVTHDTASVTVVAEDAAKADGMATALLVMGYDKGRVFAATHDIAALFIVRRESGLDYIPTASLSANLDN